MKVLAIETSCDETAVAIIETDGNQIAVLSDVISSQIAMHARFGGVVPSLAAREHAANIEHVATAALAEASIADPEHDLDLIAVTYGPGLGPALLVGLMFARTLAWRWKKPLVGVNHMDGHIHSNWLPSEAPSATLQAIRFPALNLIVSGGHTELVLMHGHGEYDIIGETQDDAVGEAFDKVARMLDLGYPGGPKISALAEAGDAKAYPLPRPMLQSPNFDFSYSGLKTAVLYLIRDITGGGRELTDREKADIAASFQEAAVDVLIQKTRRAARQYGVGALLLSGGVSANMLLRTRLRELGKELRLPCFIPALRYTTDNATMIAVAGYYAWQKRADASATGWQSVSMDANLRLGHNTKT